MAIKAECETCTLRTLGTLIEIMRCPTYFDYGAQTPPCMDLNPVFNASSGYINRMKDGKGSDVAAGASFHSQASFPPGSNE